MCGLKASNVQNGASSDLTFNFEKKVMLPFIAGDYLRIGLPIGVNGFSLKSDFSCYLNGRTLTTGECKLSGSNIVIQNFGDTLTASWTLKIS